MGQHFRPGLHLGLPQEAESRPRAVPHHVPAEAWASALQIVHAEFPGERARPHIGQDTLRDADFSFRIRSGGYRSSRNHWWGWGLPPGIGMTKRYAVSEDLFGDWLWKGMCSPAITRPKNKHVTIPDGDFAGRIP
jgi:hypothetical protein